MEDAEPEGAAEEKDRAWPARGARLGGLELVLLQLLWRGYAPGQVVALRGGDETTLLADLHRALAALDAATLEDALAVVRERGLIV